MKRFIRLLVAFSLSLVLTLSLAGAAFADDSSISYSGATRSFTFDTGADLFGSFKDLMPGDTVSQSLDIKVDPAANMETRIYLRAETVAGENAAAMQDFLKQLSMTVRQGDTVIYQASPDQLSGLQENVLLGVFRQAGSARLTIDLIVPKTLGNEYANRSGLVRWVLTADEVDVTPFVPMPGIVITPAEENIPDEDVPMVDFTEIDDETTPMSSFRGSSWALLNLLAAIVTVGIGGAELISYVRNEKDAPAEEGRKLKGKLVSVAPAFGAAVVFVLTEDMSTPMVMTDKWTALMVGILALNCLIAYLTRLSKKAPSAA